MTKTKTPTAPKPGVYLDIPFDVYRAWPGINYSSIAKGTKSMLAMHAAMTTATPPTAAMALGTLTHLAVLEPDLFGGVPTFAGGGRLTKAFKAAQAGMSEDLYLDGEVERAKELRDIVRKDREACWLIDNSKHEVCLTWTDDVYGAGKIRIDMMGADFFADLKTARSIALPDMVREFTGRYGRNYYLQWGWFWEGLDHLGGVKEMDGWVVAVETGDVPDAYAAKVNYDLIRRGQEDAVEIAREYAACRACGVYTGAAGGDIPEIYLPDWMTEDWSPNEAKGGDK